MPIQEAQKNGPKDVASANNLSFWLTVVVSGPVDQELTIDQENYQEPMNNHRMNRWHTVVVSEPVDQERMIDQENY